MDLEQFEKHAHELYFDLEYGYETQRKKVWADIWDLVFFFRDLGKEKHL